MPQSFSTPALTDVQTVSFKPQGGQTVDFNAHLTEWSDTRKPRVAYHEYLKRDGGEAEYMGRSPHSVRMNLVYMGPDWRKEFLVLQNAIDTSPIGVLIHPFFGSMPVVCDGIEGAQVSISEALDLVTIPISFRESNLNQQLTSSLEQGPGNKESHVDRYSARLTKATQIYVTATTAVSLFQATARSYSSAALASSLSTALPDPTLPQQLANVGVHAAAARLAIRADPLALDDASTFPAIQAIEQLNDVCNQLAESLKTMKPVLTPYVIPSQTTLLALAQQYYGKDAAPRMTEILANNLGKIPNPAAILPGIALLMATPTVAVVR